MSRNLAGARPFDELLRHAVHWREANNSIDNAFLLDALVIVCQLHTGDIDKALAAIDALVSTPNYMFLSMHEALKKVGRRIPSRDARGVPAYRDRLRPALERVLARYNELSELSGEAPTDG